MFAAKRMAMKMARPLEALTEATRRLGAGELSYRVELPQRRRHRHRPGRGINEIFTLGESFNEMAERVERLVRGQRELLANVSHELRSPLARIRVALELVPRTVENEPRLAGVEEDLEELDALIDDVLTASRLDGAAAPAHMETVDLDRLVDTLVERAATQPGLEGATVTRVGEAGEITADARLLRRALWNLVENAGKHGAPPITAALARGDDGVTITVADRGPGVPAEDRERVFEPFTRLDPARSSRGVGLGLTIARRVAEVHGGTLVAGDGEHGFGFTLSLPR
jgi:signal transduction histidine kinase